MNRRTEIGTILKEILGNFNTYFQPTTNTQMKYPCATYSLDGINQKVANDEVYVGWKRFMVTFITKDPDNTYYEKMIKNFRHVRFDRRYVADGLYHDVYTIY